MNKYKIPALLIIIILSFSFFSFFDAFEHFAEWISKYEAIEMDEWVPTLFLSLIGLSAFSYFKMEQAKKTNQHLQQQIRERKKIEEKLIESENLYSLIFESMHEGIIVLDKDFTYTHWNRAMEEISGGVTRDDVIKSGTKPWELFPILSRHGIDSMMKQAMDGKVCHKNDLQWDDCITSESYFPLLTSEGEICGVLGVIRDVTEQNKIAEDMEKSEQRYREYFEDNLAGTYILTAEGNLIACNSEFLSVFGFQNFEEAQDKNISDYFIDPAVKTEMISRLRKEGRLDGFSIDLKKADQTTLHIVTNASAEFDENGRINYVRGFLLDETEQRQLEARFLQAQKMEAIGTLAGGIAHDFNNILFPILGYSQMLLHDIPENHPSRGHVDKIQSGALRAKDLVRQILTFSRQDTSKVILMRLQPIIKEALKLIRHTIPTTIDIIKDIQPDCGIVKADPTQIHQVIMNLTTNAYHAMMDTGGKLEVTLTKVEINESDMTTPNLESGVYACLTVSDTGVGMSKDVVAHIFDPFFTTKGKKKGTGLGLSVVHGIVKSVNGDIQVVSSPGKGSTFKIYFSCESDRVAKKEDPVLKPLPGGTEQILIIDDEHDIIEMEKELLESLGYRVTVRTSSIEALEAFRANPDKFDLVITDMAMPKLRGDKLAEKILNIRPDIPILLCTGFSENISEEKVLSLGIKGFLMKPIIVKALAEKIRAILDTDNTEIHD